MTISMFPIQKHENGLISVLQHKIKDYVLSYNPDDNRFHISKQNDYTSIATFASNKKGYANATYWIKARVKKERGKTPEKERSKHG